MFAKLTVLALLATASVALAGPLHRGRALRQLPDACKGLLVAATNLTAIDGPFIIGNVTLKNPSTAAIQLSNVTYQLAPSTPVAPLFGLANCTGTKESSVSVAANATLVCPLKIAIDLPPANWSSIGITAFTAGGDSARCTSEVTTLPAAVKEAKVGTVSKAPAPAPVATTKPVNATAVATPAPAPAAKPANGSATVVVVTPSLPTASPSVTVTPCIGDNCQKTVFLPCCPCAPKSPSPSPAPKSPSPSPSPSPTPSPNPIVIKKEYKEVAKNFPRLHITGDAPTKGITYGGSKKGRKLMATVHVNRAHPGSDKEDGKEGKEGKKKAQASQDPKYRDQVYEFSVMPNTVEKEDPCYATGDCTSPAPSPSPKPGTSPSPSPRPGGPGGFLDGESHIDFAIKVYPSLPGPTTPSPSVPKPSPSEKPKPTYNKKDIMWAKPEAGSVYEYLLGKQAAYKAKAPVPEPESYGKPGPLQCVVCECPDDPKPLDGFFELRPFPARLAKAKNATDKDNVTSSGIATADSLAVVEAEAEPADAQAWAIATAGSLATAKAGAVATTTEEEALAAAIAQAEGGDGAAATAAGQSATTVDKPDSTKSTAQVGSSAILTP